MRLLKIVAVPAAVALLLTTTNASEAEARVRSKILGNIQRNTLSQTQKEATLVQQKGAILAQKGAKLAQTKQENDSDNDACVDCDTPCHLKHEHNNGQCPGGDQYDPEEFEDREDLYNF